MHLPCRVGGGLLGSPLQGEHSAPSCSSTEAGLEDQCPRIAEKAMASHSSTLACKIPRTGSLVGCSPWGREESDTTEQLHFHFSLSCIEEGNGNPLQCSCLENPRDRGVWWAAIYGVAQSRTRLKRLSGREAGSCCFPTCSQEHAERETGVSSDHTDTEPQMLGERAQSPQVRDS